MGLLKVAIDRLLTTDPAGWLGHKLTEPQDPMPETIGEAMDMVRTNAKMAIDSATEQLQAKLATHRWIPVEERLPKPDENTHPQQSVKVKLAKIIEVDAWYEDCDKHWHDARTGEVIKGTHWRPTTVPEGE